jgi:hypothetical protein
MNSSKSGLETGNQEPTQQTPHDPSSEAPSNSSRSSGTPLKGKAQIDAIAALMRGEPANPEPEGDELEDDPEGDIRDPLLEDRGQSDETPGIEAEKETKAKGKLTPQEVAEKLDIKPDAVYDMDIPLRDGESVSLGKLKDLWQEREAVEQEIAQKSTDLDRREATVIADQQAWAVLAAQGGLTGNALNEARQIVGKQIEREQGLLFDLMPDLQDAAKLDLFRRDLVRVMGKVGYKPHEIVLGDHRQGLLLREFISMERELNALRKANKKPPPKSHQPNGRGAKLTRKQETPHGLDAKTAAVRNLIGSRK